MKLHPLEKPLFFHPQTFATQLSAIQINFKLMGTSKQWLNMSIKSNRKRRTSRKINSDHRPHKLIRLADGPVLVFSFFKWFPFVRKQICSLNT